MNRLLRWTLPLLMFFPVVMAYAGTGEGEDAASPYRSLSRTSPSDVLFSRDRLTLLSSRLTSAAPYSLALPQSDDAYVPWEARKRPLAAITEIAILEFIPWALARWIRDWEDPADNWAKVSSDTWWENINKGWEYDGDNFLTNTFAHPFHGALFFNAGRTNGYTYWESLPFSLMGSAVWEYFGETFRPAFNDWINTGVTGANFGEALYRLSSLMTDNTATGSERVWREIGGALINPVRGFNRLISGETARVFPNAAEHSPSVLRPVFTAGIRRMDADGTDLVKDAVTQALLSLDFQYGDIMRGDYKIPFSSFTFNLTLAIPNREEDSTGAMNRLSVDGTLHGWELSSTDEVTHVLTLRGLYDYMANPAFEFGRTGLGADVRSSWRLNAALSLTTEVMVFGILMGGTPSDYYVDVEGRNYDFGPGVGNRITASLVTNGWPVLSLWYMGGYIWTQSEPSRSRHNFHMTVLQGRYPFTDRLSLGLSLGMYWRESHYAQSYYDRIQPAPPQPFDPEVSRKHPIGTLAFSYVLW